MEIIILLRFCILIFSFTLFACAGGPETEILPPGGKANPDGPAQKPLPASLVLNEKFNQNFSGLTRIQDVRFTNDGCGNLNCTINLQWSDDNGNNNVSVNARLGLALMLEKQNAFFSKEPLEAYVSTNGDRPVELLAFRVGEIPLQFFVKGEALPTLREGQFINGVSIVTVKKIDANNTYMYSLLQKPDGIKGQISVPELFHDYLKNEDNYLFFNKVSTTFALHNQKVIGIFYQAKQKLAFARQD